jgi:hypothetical protein
MAAIFCSWAFYPAPPKLPAQRSRTFTTLQVGHPDRTIIIDGIEQDLTGYLINGMSTAGSRLGQASLNLSVAAIDQFKIHEGFFLPSEGPNDGGVVSLATKGGSNHLHGEDLRIRQKYGRSIQGSISICRAPSPAPFTATSLAARLADPFCGIAILLWPLRGPPPGAFQHGKSHRSLGKDVWRGFLRTEHHDLRSVHL